MARQALENLKYEVAAELGYFNPQSSEKSREYRRQLDQRKFEIAKEIGIPLKEGYNGGLTTRETGAIGGRLGGQIGGQMVKKMIEYAEEKMSQT